MVYCIRAEDLRDLIVVFIIRTVLSQNVYKLVNQTDLTNGM